MPETPLLAKQEHNSIIQNNDDVKAADYKKQVKSYNLITTRTMESKLGGHNEIGTHIGESIMNQED